MNFKDLTKKDRRHLREMGITTLRDFQSVADYQMRQRREQRMECGRVEMEPCFECKSMAQRLGLPV